MDLEPPLVSPPSIEIESPRFNNDSDQILSEEEDPYSLNSTSISLLGLAIAFLMLGIPTIAVLIYRPTAKSSHLPIYVDQYGSQSPPPISISWIS